MLLEKDIELFYRIKEELDSSIREVFKIMGITWIGGDDRIETEFSPQKKVLNVTWDHYERSNDHNYEVLIPIEYLLNDSSIWLSSYKTKVEEDRKKKEEELRIKKEREKQAVVENRYNTYLRLKAEFESSNI